MEFGDAIGEGADGDTRGRVFSPILSRPFVTRGSGPIEVASLFDRRSKLASVALPWFCPIDDDLAGFEPLRDEMRILAGPLA
jgi:hypothetical protein